MTPTPRRLDPVSMTALVIAMIALLAASAGVGYAAATVGTKDIKNKAVTAKKIKNNAVTTKKIKNDAVDGAKVKDGSLTAADLVANEVQRAATLGNGGEGDCIYQSVETLLPGTVPVTFRKDRFGTVHLTGVIVGGDGPGGDGVCDFSDPGQASDAVATILPAGYIPAKSMIFNNGGGDLLLIAGASGFTGGSGFLPPGAIVDNSFATGGNLLVLDGISFEPAGSSVVLSKKPASGRIAGSSILGIG